MTFSLEKKINIFRQRVIKWYNIYGDYDLPWRKSKNPWEILIAAFLLRKTTVQQVRKIYEKFLEKYNSPKKILETTVDEIEEIIRPLGMEHIRAYHLIELAKKIVEKFNGQVPCSNDELKELPGVGDYIASEILLASCGKPEPLLDRNMIRILERVFGIKSSRRRPHMDPLLWEFAKGIIPKDPETARIFNYGVLDFARKICTARKPKCILCVMKDLCLYVREATGE